MDRVIAPGERRLVGDGVVLRPPTAVDINLIAALMSADSSPARAGAVLDRWADGWEADGFGAWVVTEGAGLGRAIGTVALRGGAADIRVAVRALPEVGADELVARGLRLALADALEYLPDLPLRARVLAEDDVSRALLESGGMLSVPADDHVADGREWSVLEAPAIRCPRSVSPGGAEAMLDLWVAVNEAGGAVGFVPGATREDVAQTLDGYLTPESSDRRVQPVLLLGPDGELLGQAFVVISHHALRGHIGSAERVMVDPEIRGRNLGRLLMAGVHRAARDAGLEMLTLDYRGGMGLGGFYDSLGYREYGRLPGAIRVAAEDARDQVYLVRDIA